MDYVNNEAGVYVADALFVDGKVPVLTGGIALKPGQATLKRGSVICKDNDGKGVLVSKTNIADSFSGAVSGAVATITKTSGYKIVGVLTDDTVTPETGTVIAAIYRTGHFNSSALTFAAGTIIGDVEYELAKVGIYVSSVQEV